MPNCTVYTLVKPVYTMPMNYTIRELRANLKEAFDRADNHEMVGVIRNGIQYYIQTAPVFHSRVYTESPIMVEKEVMKQFEEEMAVESPDNSKLGERSCCGMKKPCIHWQWDGDEQAWINSLSGRIKEDVSV